MAQTGATVPKKDPLFEEYPIPNIHAEAWAERQRDPGRYEDPAIPTPGVLEDVDEETYFKSLVEAEDAPGVDPPLDPTVDNRDQVQPMLDTIRQDLVDKREAQGMETPEALAAGHTASKTDRKAEEAKKAAEDAKKAEDKK